MYDSWMEKRGCGCLTTISTLAAFFVERSLESSQSMVSSLDVQRLFLQSAISRRVLSAELAKVIWKQCVDAVNKGLVIVPSHLFLLTQRRANTTAAGDTHQVNAGIANDWGAFLASLNKSLDPLDLELSRIRNEVTGKDMYALVRCIPQRPPGMF